MPQNRRSVIWEVWYPSPFSIRTAPPLGPLSAPQFAAAAIPPIHYSRVARDHTGDDVSSVGEKHCAAQKTRKVSCYLSLLIHEYDRLHSYNMLSHPVQNL